jgi:translation elongation factor EF-1beta
VPLACRIEEIREEVKENLKNGLKLGRKFSTLRNVSFGLHSLPTVVSFPLFNALFVDHVSSVSLLNRNRGLEDLWWGLWDLNPGQHEYN